MDVSTIAISATIGIVTSIVGGILVFFWIRLRAKRIEDKIEGLVAEEEYLDKLSRGNIRLLRSTFTILFIVLFVVLSASALILIYYGFKIYSSNALEGMILLLAGYFIGIASGICIMHARSIISLKNIGETKAKLRAKKVKLEQNK